MGGSSSGPAAGVPGSLEVAPLTPAGSSGCLRVSSCSHTSSPSALPEVCRALSALAHAPGASLGGAACLQRVPDQTLPGEAGDPGTS